MQRDFATPPTAVDRPWLAAYPAGVPHDVNVEGVRTLVDLIDTSFKQFAQRPASVFMGRETPVHMVDALSAALCAHLQGLGLDKGARVAVMMPNLPQYQVAVAAILRAGMVVVNVNPLYTPRELAHQLSDSGALAIFIVENFAGTLQACLHQTLIKHIILTAVGDMLGAVKGRLVNAAVRHVKKGVPAFSLPGAVRFPVAVARGRRLPRHTVDVGPDDIALLQYTGGTTGVSKGAVLLHRNVLANVLQNEAWNIPVMSTLVPGAQPTTVCALPLYHIFSFTVCMMLSMRSGGRLLLIPDPRDLPAVFKALRGTVFHNFPAVNTLFNGLLHHPQFDTVNWRNLRIAVGGGMAVQAAVAQRWLERTGCPICEGYGLSETAPTASCNPTNSRAYSGSIGVPLPGTLMKCLADDGSEQPAGVTGEIAIKGPQLMARYWRRPEETALVMTPDGYFKTGDIGVMDTQGFFRIVDRKKDMILVSGFNVYPNEIEDVVAAMAEVLECAAVGIADEKTGEAVKLVVVRRDPALTQDAVARHCRNLLTAYKCPKIVEFRDALPKTPIGKILRRELRDAARV